MRKHLTKILMAIIVILSVWVAILVSPANDFLSLTGLYHLPIPEDAEAHPVDPEKGYYTEISLKPEVLHRRVMSF